MVELILKIIITPENILKIILASLPIIALCIIFNYKQEKWWKALIPFYSDYIFYKFAFGYGALCVVEFIFDILNGLAIGKIKKHLFFNIIDFIKEKEFEIENINETLLIALLLVYFITAFIIFIYKRVAYSCICANLNLNMFFVILTFIIPEIFLFIDILYRKHLDKKHLNRW